MSSGTLQVAMMTSLHGLAMTVSRLPGMPGMTGVSLNGRRLHGKMIGVSLNGRRLRGKMIGVSLNGKMTGVSIIGNM